jgi:hypothetical protein
MNELIARGLHPLEATGRFSLHVSRYDSDSKLAVLVARFGLDATRRGGQAGSDAHMLVFGSRGTFSESTDKSVGYEQGSITVACYLCNTFLKTARTGSLCVVLLLRVQNCSGMLIVRRRGASRGRPVKWFA